MTAPRGISNCNPGNIRRSHIAWQGMAVEQPDADFITFKSPHWGIRAMALILLAYERKHGLNTVRGLINRWAPSNENDTAAYVSDVATRCGLVSDNPIKVDDPVVLAKLCQAIIFHECGQCPYAMTAIMNAVDDALGIDSLTGTAHA